MLEPMSRKTRLSYFIFFAVIFVIVIPFIILYSSGYRLSKDLSLVGTGGVYVYATESDVSIFLNGQLEKETNIFSKSIYIDNLSPQTYTLRVTKPESIDWNKTVTVTDKQVAEAYPFLVPKNATTTEVIATITDSITGKKFSNPLFQTVDLLFKKVLATSTLVTIGTTTKATTSPEALSVPRKEIKVWQDGGIVYAKWLGDLSEAPFQFCVATSTCVSQFEVYNDASIKRVDFYPNRNDVILFSRSDGVYATELDLRPPHNTIKIYDGKNVDFRLQNGDRLFVKDQGVYYEVKL